MPLSRFFYPVVLAAFACRAGSPPATLRGRVVDPLHAPIAGAGVALAAAGASLLLTSATSPDGEFAITAPAGEYFLTLNKDGFETTVRRIVLSARGDGPREFILAVAPVSFAVTVAGDGGYLTAATSSATRTLTPLIDVPQAITVIPRELMADQMMTSMAEVVRYVPGITSHQGENNRDQLVIRGNSTSADFFVDGVRDDVQYYRDLYNLDRVEALKGPNAMTFGRGGAGGVINRVTKEAGPASLHEFTVEGGSFGEKRFTADLDQPLTTRIAARLNAMFENSDSFRDYVGLERYGVSPTIAITAGSNTRITLSYESFRDGRTADRGIPSFQGRPVDVPVSAYFGEPDNSQVNARVNLGAAFVEHQTGRFNIRNRTLLGDYGRGYQNFVPGAVSADASVVNISAYNNATHRLNFFNQTDVTLTAYTGRIRHTLLGGVEVGRQFTDNLRNTGYFNNTATIFAADLDDAVIQAPVVFRQSTTDADNRVRVNLGAAFLQDQVELSRYLQVVAGLRFDRFDLRYHNNRTAADLGRLDNLVSPRLGLVFKPAARLSLYGSYSVSYLPSSGDQFASLTTVTQQVKPENFRNYETGVKWDISRALSLTAALYRLDRTNTRSTDPNDPARIVQTGSQRTNGFEAGLTGRITRAWQVAGGYAWQDAFVTSATVSARAGAQVAQVPHHTFSLWNNYQLLPRLGAGLGILNRTRMFAAIDNTVTLPGYTRADAAVFYSLTGRVRLQVNVENLLNCRYYANADNNTNISPGSPRAARAGLIARF